MKKVVIALTIAALLIVASVAGAAVAKSGLNGSWQTKITSPKNLKGTWTLKLTPGKYNVKLGKSAIVNGKDTITGNKISLTDTGGPGKCKGTGVYKFKITGNKLNFTKVSDTKACSGRSTVLKHTFTRVAK
jgi:hypothetical protein